MLKLNSVRKILQPAICKIPGYRKCQNCSYADQKEKLFGNKDHQTFYACTDYLSHANFFCPLFRGKSRQPQQSQAGNEDGETREHGEDLTTLFIRLVL